MRLALERALSSGADFSELFIEDRDDLMITSVEREIKGLTSLHIRGAGIRLLAGTRSVYVHTNDCSEAGLLRLAARAAELLPPAVTAPGRARALTRRVFESPNPVRVGPETVDSRRKIGVLKEMDGAARSAGKVRCLNATYFDSRQRVMVLNSEGLQAEDERVRTRVRLESTVEWGAESLFEFDDLVGPCGFELFDTDYAAFAVRQVQAMTNRLKAQPLESCVVPVVIEGGSGGVLWHEACGHPLEADNIVTGQGEFAGMMGLRVASDKVTLIDDGSIKGMYGSEAIDDEGQATRPNVLIEKGILRGYLCDRRGARLLGTESTGSGRRQGYAYEPSSRMHNTYLAAGEDDEEEMIGSMGDGLFVTELGGGNGGIDFSIEVKDAFWVRGGKISHQVRGITLSGNCMEIIQKVDRVGKRLMPEEGGSFCGGPSGLLPTTVFQPRMRISEMSVGGLSR